MKFTQSVQGIDAVNGGIGSIFKALAQAPLLRQQAEEQAALRNAQTYSANMAGNKYGSEAAGNQYTLDMRKAMPDRIADPTLTAGVRRAYEAFQLGGPQYVDQMMKGFGEGQTQDIRQQAVDNVGNVDMMNRYNTLAKPGETYEPFKVDGGTGRYINSATGGGGIFEKTLAKIYDDYKGAQTASERAQAANYFASAGQHNATTEKLKQQTALIQSGGSGKPLTAAQLRENAAIQEAREAIAGMQQAEVDAILKENPGFMTADQRVKFNIIQRAQKPMFGETDVPVVNPIPAPPPAAPEPGMIAQAWDWLTAPDVRPAAKSPAAGPAAPKMDAAPNPQAAEKIRADYRAGKITRDEAKKQLQAIGFD